MRRIQQRVFFDPKRVQLTPMQSDRINSIRMKYYRTVNHLAVVAGYPKCGNGYYF